MDFQSIALPTELSVQAPTIGHKWGIVSLVMAVVNVPGEGERCVKSSGKRAWQANAANFSRGMGFLAVAEEEVPGDLYQDADDEATDEAHNN
jgi:hypothetical protein